MCKLRFELALRSPTGSYCVTGSAGPANCSAGASRIHWFLHASGSRLLRRSNEVDNSNVLRTMQRKLCGFLVFVSSRAVLQIGARRVRQRPRRMLAQLQLRLPLVRVQPAHVCAHADTTATNRTAALYLNLPVSLCHLTCCLQQPCQPGTFLGVGQRPHGLFQCTAGLLSGVGF